MFSVFYKVVTITWLAKQMHYLYSWSQEFIEREYTYLNSPIMQNCISKKSYKDCESLDRNLT